MLNHTENWDFYLCHVDNKPASIFLDLGLYSIAPIPDKAHLFWIAVKMQSPKEDGLSSEAESEQLWELEDQLTAALVSGNATLYVGRETSDGTRTFYFYRGEQVAVELIVENLMTKFPAYQYKTGAVEHDNWNAYFDFLYPSPLDIQSIENRKVVDRLEAFGDPLTDIRIVDHWIYFSSEADREDFKAAVIQQGFEIRKQGFEADSAENPYHLIISRPDKVTWPDIDACTIPLWELAQVYNGDYNGWECPVLSASGK